MTILWRRPTEPLAADTSERDYAGFDASDNRGMTHEKRIPS
jgi:hypothetical protein